MVKTDCWGYVGSWHTNLRLNGGHCASNLCFSCTRGADKSLARPTSHSIVLSVQGTGGSPTGPDPENRVGDQDIGSAGRPFSSGFQVSGQPLSFLVGLRTYQHPHSLEVSGLICALRAAPVGKEILVRSA
jgi:hypothetical protein